MKKFLQTLVILAIVGILTFGVLIQNSAAATPSNTKEYCEMVWGLYLNHKCYIYDPAYCGADTPWYVFTYDPITDTIYDTCEAGTVDNWINYAQNWCVVYGGTYYLDGKCYFKATSGMKCTPSNYEVWYQKPWYNQYFDNADFYTYWKFGGCSSFLPNKTGYKVTDTGYGSFSIGKADFSYEAQTCTGVCRIINRLTPQAKADLYQIPGKVLKSVYVQIKDDNGNPVYGNYKVCFKGMKANNPQVWRWAGNETGWVLDSTQRCFYSTYGGNYAFVNGDLLVNIPVED